MIVRQQCFYFPILIPVHWDLPSTVDYRPSDCHSCPSHMRDVALYPYRTHSAENCSCNHGDLGVDADGDDTRPATFSCPWDDGFRALVRVYVLSQWWIQDRSERQFTDNTLNKTSKQRETDTHPVFQIADLDVDMRETRIQFKITQLWQFIQSTSTLTKRHGLAL